MDEDIDRCRMHREQMRTHLKRAIVNAKSHDFILGFRVMGRHDVSCPLKGRFCGAFLPDELPVLYPEDCPEERACACITYEFVMRGDDTVEAAQLREKSSDFSAPNPEQLEVMAQPVCVTSDEPSSENFTFAEVRVLRKLLQVPSPFIWDEKGYWTSEAGYPSSELFTRLVAIGWVREATQQEKLMKLMTVAKLREVCSQCTLKKTGDKEMLAERLAISAPEQASALTSGAIVAVVMDEGKSKIELQSGHARKAEMQQDLEEREQSYQKLVHYARQTDGAKIQVNANSWSSCEKLPQIVGVYDPSEAPWLPLGDCPNIGLKPCACWSAWIVGAPPGQRQTRAASTQVAQDVQFVEAAPVISSNKRDPNSLIRWIARVIVFFK